MKKNKNWFKRHPVWTGIIGFFLLMILIGVFIPKDNSSDDYKKSEPLISQDERKVSILAEKEKIEFCSSINGVLVLVSVYDKGGNCDWINGHAKVILKDSLGNIIETKEKDLKEKDILLGSNCMADFPEMIINDINKLDKIESATLEYTTIDGKKHTSSEKVTKAFDYCFEQTNNQESIELNDDTKKELTKLLLESPPYDYSVIRIVLDYNDELGNYASIGMISKGETTGEVAEQIGAGLGALYGNWKDKDYYAVALNNYINICTFAIDGDTTKNLMDGKISDVELFLSLESVCIPV